MKAKKLIDWAKDHPAVLWPLAAALLGLVLGGLVF